MPSSQRQRRGGRDDRLRIHRQGSNAVVATGIGIDSFCPGAIGEKTVRIFDF
jgi:hypothetical protein